MALSADQLNTIYQNVLFRNVDQGGIQFFANRTDISDAQVRQQIELSAEASNFVSPIVRLYQEVLGRVPDQGGLKFFSGQLRAGTSLDNIAQQLISSSEFSAKTTATSGVVDSTDLSNTNQLVSDAFQSILGRTPGSSEFAFFQGKTAAQILSAVAGSPEAAQSNAAGTVTFLDSVAQGTYPTGSLNGQTGGANGGTNSGTNFVLTTSIDNVVGTAGNDTITADNTAATKTLSTADSINGGAGTDTLKVFLAAGDTAVPFPSTLTSVENIYTNGGAVTALDVSKLSGVTSVQVDAPVANTAETITVAGQAVILSNFNSTANTTTTIASTTDTAETITLSKFAAATGVANTLDLSGTKVAALSLVSTGGSNAVTLTDTGAALTSLTITGDQKLTLTESLTALKTINASAATGAISVDVSGLGADNNLTFTGGTGNDSIKFAAGQLTATDVLDGGAGTDTLTVSDAAYAGINAAKNFEILGLGASGLTLDASQVTNGIKEFALSVAGSTETISNLAAGSTIDINAATTTSTLSGAVGNSAVNINLGTSTGAGFTTTSLTTTGLTTVNLKVLGTSAETITTFANSDNSAINITGSTDLTVTNALAGTATGSSVDATGLSGKLSIIGSGFGDVIKAGTGGSVITGGAGADQLTANTGIDKFVYTTLTDSVATNGSTTNDTVTSFAAGTDKFQVTTAPTAIQQGANFTATGTGQLATDVGTAINNGTATFAANNVAVVTINGGADAGTYAVINNGTAGYAAAADAVIKLVGLTGTLATTDFVTA